jgi:tetratricopeptide (TPR) repeat protein
MFDSTLLITAAVLLGGALISGFLKGREKDRVLNAFSGYHITLEKIDGRLVWGEMTLHPTGMELIYRSDVQDEQHVETSYILYKDEFPQIQAVYRYCDEMESRQWQRREQDLRRSFHPGFWQRLRRRSRNVVNLVSDSLGQAIGILVGQIQTSTQGLTAGSEDYISNVGKNIVGYVGTKYDPLLERYVGTLVVVEVTEGGTVYEHIGILKDYTADFLEILDVHYPNQTAVHVRDEDCCEEQGLRVVRDGDTLHVSNVGQYSLYLQRLRFGDQVTPLNAVLDKDDNLDLHLPVVATGANIDLDVKIVRHLDWILPRSHALIRHKAERYDPDQVFDIGFVLRLDLHHGEREEYYLKALEENPENAPYALELGQLLFQRGEIDDAARWFRQALDHRDYLHDGGKLAERQLRYIEQKKAGQKRAA